MRQVSGKGGKVFNDVSQWKGGIRVKAIETKQERVCVSQIGRKVGVGRKVGR